jgi:hypothetical protein
VALIRATQQVTDLVMKVVIVVGKRHIRRGGFKRVRRAATRLQGFHFNGPTPKQDSMIDGGRRNDHRDVSRYLDETCPKMVPALVISVHI